MKNTLTQKLRLLANVEDKANNEFFAEIEFRDIYGSSIDVANSCTSRRAAPMTFSNGSDV